MEAFTDTAGRRLERYGRGSRVLARLHRDDAPIRRGALYALDYGVYGARITGGWHRTPWGSRVPAVDETWILYGFEREDAARFVEKRRATLVDHGIGAEVAVLDAYGQILHRFVPETRGSVELDPPPGLTPVTR